MSSSYTTTTSATGMPTIGMEYHTTKKSSTGKSSGNSSPVAIKKSTSNRSKSYAGVLTPAERSSLLKSHSRSFSQSSPTTQHSNSISPNTAGGLFPAKKELATSDETIFKVEIERGKPIFFEGMDASESENETNESTDDEAMTSSSVLSTAETTTSATTTAVKDIVPLNNTNTSNNNNNNNRTKFVLDERLEDVKETPEKEVPLQQPKQLAGSSGRVSITKTASTPTPTTSSMEDPFDVDNKDSITADSGDKTEPVVEKSATDVVPSATDAVDRVNLVVNSNNIKDNSENNNSSNSNSIKELTPPRRGLRKMSDTSRTLRRGSSTEAGDATSVTSADFKTSSSFDAADNLVIPVSNQSRRKSSRELHMEYEIAISRDIDEMLGQVKEWDFPIFELSEKCNVLTQVFICGCRCCCVFFLFFFSMVDEIFVQRFNKLRPFCFFFLFFC